MVGIPKVAEGAASLILGRDSFPELATALLAAVPDTLGHDMAGRAAQSQPYPALLALFPKGDLRVQPQRPECVQFEDVARLPCDQCSR
jgi:hypothetical protein